MPLSFVRAGTRTGASHGDSEHHVSMLGDPTPCDTRKSLIEDINDIPDAISPTADMWITRARPMFLYVMYAILLWALPLGLIAAIDPAKAQAISLGMTGYLNALPEPLYTLFGTGYLGYAALRQWGKIKGAER